MEEFVVGADRVAAVRVVVEAFGAGGGPRLVILDAPAGSGRTFVLRQAYRRIAGSQESAYWPPSLSHDMLVPALVEPAEGSKISWLWLGLVADPLAGPPLRQIADQLDAHTEVLRHTLEARGRLGRQLATWAGEAASLTIGGLGLISGGLLSGIAAAAAVFSLLWSVRAVLDAVPTGGSVDSALAFNAGHIVNPRESAEIRACIDELASGLAVVAQILPIFIVIDDAETLDEQAASLVQALVRGAADITVVVAVDLVSTTGGWGDWLRTTDFVGKQVARLDRLREADLSALAVRTLPVLSESSSHLAMLLSASDGQPGVLNDYLVNPTITEILRSGDPIPPDLASLTRPNIDDRRFQSHPRPVQEQLQLLAAVGGATWLEWLPALGIDSADLRTAATAGYVRTEDQLVRFINDRVFHAALRASQAAAYPSTQTRNLLDSYSQVVMQTRISSQWERLPYQVRQAALIFLIGRDPAEALPDLRAELLDLQRRNGQLSAFTAALQDALHFSANTSGVGGAHLLRATADTLATIGRFDLAIGNYQAELDRLTAKHGPRSPARTPAVEALAHLEAAVGHDLLGQPEASTYLHAAANHYREVLNLREPRLRELVSSRDQQWHQLQSRIAHTRWRLAETLVDLRAFDGPEGALHHAQTAIFEFIDLGRANDFATLARRSQLAAWTGAAGRHAEARELSAALLPDLQRVVGPNHPYTLVNRNMHAGWTAQAGEPARARNLFNALLPDIESELGPDHPETLTTRNNHALATAQAGHLQQAKELITALLPDLERVQGTSHPDTLTTRSNLIQVIGELGDPAAARDLTLDLLAVQARYLGPEHENTLTSRHHVARWTGEAGQPGQAKDLLEALLPDRQRVLGPDHPDTFATRHDLANWIHQTGDVVRAKDLTASLLTDRVRVLGPDHPDTFTTRHNLAQFTGEAGDPALARDLTAALLADRKRVLGPDHLDTLNTRHNLAHWTGQAGQRQQAKELLEALLPDRRRVLGPDHPDTLRTRHALALSTGYSGNPAGARDQLESLLEDEKRALGINHPDSLTSRHNLAHWTGVSGDPVRARDLLADLLTDMHKVVGPECRATLTTRKNLAQWAGEAGDPGKAKQLTAALLADCIRVLGPDDPDTATVRQDLAHWSIQARSR